MDELYHLCINDASSSTSLATDTWFIPKGSARSATVMGYIPTKNIRRKLTARLNLKNSCHVGPHLKQMTGRAPGRDRQPA